MKNKWSFTILRAVVLGGIMALASSGFSAATPEVRGLWISRFEWPSANQTTCKANIDAVMTKAAANGFNTVFFQVRGQCDTYYPSPYEPWASTFGYSNPGWDPLAYAIQSAHSRGLKFHAYINTHVLSGSAVPSGSTTPEHPYNLHGPNVPIAQSWMIRTSPTGSAGLVDSYYWISPGIPEASWWTRQAILHIVKNYDVDGVHFDRIRCPASTYSHDPITEARFAGDGNPDKLAWADFMRSQITRDLRNIYGEIQRYKPNVQVSAAPFGIVDVKTGTNPTHYQGTGTQSYDSWFQDSWGWMNAHVVDFMVPQIYWELSDYGSAHPFDYILQDWMERSGGRYVVAGSTTEDGTKVVSHLVAEQLETRTQGAAGHCAFSYGSMADIPTGSTTDYWTGFKNGPYTETAAVPDLPWKTTPTTGFIVGTIKDAAGNPVLDAKINRNGDSYNYLSAYDGFFAMLDVTPGSTHQIVATKSGVGTARVSGVSVQAGNTTVVNLTLANTADGSVIVDRATYKPGDTVTVTVTDPDLAGKGPQSIKINSTTESSDETFQVTETATAGVFTGTMSLAAGTAVAGDGKLQVANGDTITAKYTDAADATGATVQRTATATVDAAAPVISGVQASLAGANSVTVSFNTNESASDLVRYGTVCGAPTGSATSGATGTAHSVTISGLAAGSTYFFSVEAQDLAGNLATDNNGGACYSVFVPLPMEIALEPDTFSFISSGGAYQTTQNVSVKNLASPGGDTLTWSAPLSSTENVGNRVDIAAGGTNRYRGNVYEVTHNTVLKRIESLISFTGSLSLHYVVCESTSIGTTANFTKVAEQTVTRTGSGEAYYASDDLNVPLQAGKFYIIAVGWGATTVGYVFDNVAPLNRTVSFGQERIGFGSSTYPMGSTVVQGSSINVFPQKLTTGAPSWLSWTPTSGSVAPSSSQACTFTANPTGLPAGTYNASVGFTSNDAAHNPKVANVTLRIDPCPDSLSEVFDSTGNDLANSTLCFIPNESTVAYSACWQPATAFPVDPTGGTALALTNDSFAQVSLADGKQVSLYGNSYGSFFVGSNGYITFGSGDTASAVDISAHFAKPRVSALMRDLNPAAGGRVSWKQLVDRVAVSFENIQRSGVTDSNNLQIELFFDGTIRLTWLGLGATDGVVGLSRGTGIPTGFAESDLSSYSGCSAPAAPVLVSANPQSASQIDLTWNDASNNESGFKIESNEGAGFAQILAAPRGATSISNTGLSRKTTHGYRVRAWNIWGDSEPSNEIGAQTLPVKLSGWQAE